jgi:hypothetical protein
VDIAIFLEEVMTRDGEVREARLHCGKPGFCINVCLSRDLSAGRINHTMLMSVF